MSKLIDKQFHLLADACKNGTCLDTLYRDSIRIMKTLKRGGHIKEFSTEKNKDGFIIRFIERNNLKRFWMFPKI